MTDNVTKMGSIENRAGENDFTGKLILNQDPNSGWIETRAQILPVVVPVS